MTSWPYFPVMILADDADLRAPPRPGSRQQQCTTTVSSSAVMLAAHSDESNAVAGLLDDVDDVRCPLGAHERSRRRPSGPGGGARAAPSIARHLIRHPASARRHPQPREQLDRGARVLVEAVAVLGEEQPAALAAEVAGSPACSRTSTSSSGRASCTAGAAARRPPGPGHPVDGSRRVDAQRSFLCAGAPPPSSWLQRRARGPTAAHRGGDGGTRPRVRRQAAPARAGPGCRGRGGRRG